MKTSALDPGASYLLGYHPHGILCSGAFGAFITEGCGFMEVFPGLRRTVLTLEVRLRLSWITVVIRASFGSQDTGNSVTCKPPTNFKFS